MPRILVTASFPESQLARQLPGDAMQWLDYQFVFTPESTAVDGWVVYDDLRQPVSQLCPRDNTLLITGEPSSVRRYRSRFTSQFGRVWTSHSSLQHAVRNLQNEGQPWHYGLFKSQTHGRSLCFDDLVALPRPSKTKQLSVICSGKNVTPDHRQRQAFVRYLSAELGNEIDVFGRDSRPVDDKADAIWNYKYHIVLENDHSAYYMTEKLTDAYLGWSYPLYAGGPEACLRFPSGSFTPIDIYQPEQSLSIIRRVIASNTYEQSLIQLEEARNAVLWKYNLFAMLAEYWDEFLGQQPAQLVQLVPKRFRGTLIARQLLRYFSSQHPAIHLKPKLLKATQPHSTQTQSTPTHV